jgi:hypothetical protein
MTKVLLKDILDGLQYNNGGRNDIFSPLGSSASAVKWEMKHLANIFLTTRNARAHTSLYIPPRCCVRYIRSARRFVQLLLQHFSPAPAFRATLQGTEAWLSELLPRALAVFRAQQPPVLDDRDTAARDSALWALVAARITLFLRGRLVRRLTLDEQMARRGAKQAKRVVRAVAKGLARTTGVQIPLPPTAAPRSGRRFCPLRLTMAWRALCARRPSAQCDTRSASTRGSWRRCAGRTWQLRRKRRLNAPGERRGR